MTATASIEQHRKLVPYLSRRYFPNASDTDREDLESAGLLGLWKATGGYDPARGVKFSTLAARYILTEMQKTRRMLERQRRFSPLSLEAPASESVSRPLVDLLPDDEPGPESLALSGDRRRRLWAAVETLPEEDQQLIRLYYIEGLTIQDIAKGTGENRSSLHRRLQRVAHSLRPLMRLPGARS